MGRVKSNNISLSVAVEETVGTLPTTPVWHLLEPNSVGTFGASLTTVPRNPISANRQRRKGVITDLDSSLDFDGDLTLSHFNTFIEGFMFANLIGEPDRTPSSVSTTEYTVDTGTTLPAQSLVRGVNFGVPANNGLHVTDGSSTTTTISTTLSTEATPPSLARVEVVGLEGASGDLTVDVTGGVITIGSTALDFTNFDLTPGQFIFIGGAANANRFVDDSTSNSGFVRVVSVAANAMVVDKATETFVTDAGTGKTVQIFFGRFVKNVKTTDANFLEQSYHFELDLVGLAANGTDSMYSYSKGNFANTLSLDLPLTDKATASFGFVGTDTDSPSATRAAEAENALEPNRTDAFSTASDFTRLRITDIDEAGMTTDFKSMKIELNNGVSPEKTLNTLGARFMNVGNFEVNIDTEVLFTDSEVINAVRENTTVTMDFGVKNDDGAIMFDIPSMTLGDGSINIPENETVALSVTSQAYQDATLGCSLSVSIFPFVPEL